MGKEEASRKDTKKSEEEEKGVPRCHTRLEKDEGRL